VVYEGAAKTLAAEGQKAEAARADSVAKAVNRNLSRGATD